MYIMLRQKLQLIKNLFKNIIHTTLNQISNERKSIFDAQTNTQEALDVSILGL